MHFRTTSMSKLFVQFVLYLGLLALVRAYPYATGRIVGGENAIAGAFPYQVSLRFSGSHICGASIISRLYVLSAAHCVGDEDEDDKYFVYPARYFSIRAGSNDRLRGGVVVKVTNIVTHENYANFLHDLAVLRLESALIYSKNIQPIPLASGEVPVGEQVLISGWGRLSTTGDAPTKLQYNYVQAISKLSCSTKIFMYNDALLCLGHPENNGACFGDSGGPAAYQGKLVGVASFVYGGCGTKSPDGYAKVYQHVDWIKAHTDL